MRTGVFTHIITHYPSMDGFNGKLLPGPISSLFILLQLPAETKTTRSLLRQLGLLAAVALVQ